MKAGASVKMLLFSQATEGAIRVKNPLAPSTPSTQQKTQHGNTFVLRLWLGFQAEALKIKTYCW